MAHLRALILFRTARTRHCLVVCAVVLALSGCSYGISVRRATAPSLLASWHASATETDELSPRSLQTLRRLDLVTLHQRNPIEAFNHLHALAIEDPQPDLLFALAESSYLLGRHAEKCEKCQAITYYYLCAGYAYHYLFDAYRNPNETDSQAGPPCHPPEEAFDPRFRLACDLYNTGLTKCIRAAQRIHQLDPRQQLHLPTVDDKGFELSVVHHGFAWRPEEFGPLLFCADYEVVGLDCHYASYGLGVPLIGTREATNVAAPGHAFYPRQVSFPVTAFFRFEGSVADLVTQRAGQLELYNPLVMQNIKVQRRVVPLETNLTTPLAYFLSKTDLDGIEYTAFLHADNVRDRTGIYMFQPYQPGKIPVILTHGLLSSPLTWTPLFNDLQADPVLREHFQFWFYLYPTGNSYLASAADLRLALSRLRMELDPYQRDPALDQMVFVGHSMGGLVSKLLTQTSSDDFWQLVSARPFTELKASADTRGELRRVFFFERETGIKRVIFLATPHHGSKLSPSPPVRLLAKFVHLPQKMMEAARDAAQQNPTFWPSLGRDRACLQLPTSLDLLAPGAPALELLAGRAPPPNVAYHSIIGEVFGKGQTGSDGVVPYTSAHIDGVESELVIPADHLHVHHHPRAILEVRRILYEHLQAVRAANSVIPASATAPSTK